jgi:hypothetical protein
MRHYVQIVSPLGLPMLVDGMFVESELIECRAHAIVGGVVRNQIKLEEGEPLFEAMVSLLQTVHDKSSGLDQGHSPDLHDYYGQN